jgi:hypothetical protein
MTPKPKPLPQFTPALIARFYRRLKQVDHCLLWQGTTHRQGYGYFHVKNKRYRTNRIAYFLSRGIDPGDFDVCHTCDVPNCCEPSHLFLGTQADNNRDMAVKGRAVFPRCGNPHPNPKRGIENCNAKLTEEAVRIIRSSKDSNISLAHRYGVSDMIVSLIKRRKRWTNVP